jgi:hypothetical protein
MNNGPDYLMIVGAMKCGTSSLFEYLRQHPGICPSVVKEPEYFSQSQQHGKRGDDYQALWPDYNADIHRYAMEASTGYTKWPREKGVVERIQGYGLHPKVLYIVRDPIKRIESHFNFIHQTQDANLSVEDDYLVDVSRYYKQIAPFVEAFGEQSVLVLDFDELTANPQQVVSQVYRFLNLPQYHQHSFDVHNDLQGVRAGRLLRKLRSVKLIRALTPVVPNGLKQGLKRILNMGVSSQKLEKQELSEAQQQRIRTILADDMRQLSQSFGIDIKKWGFDGKR